MPTLVLDPPPPQLEELLERRRQMGADRHDEVWEGVYHMVPGPNVPHSFIAHRVSMLLDGPARAAGLHVGTEFNLGLGKDDFRVPDLGVHRELRTGVWVPTAAIVVEILSPIDEAWQKLPFYARRGVDELLLVNPADRSVTWLALREGEYRPVARSGLIDLGASELAEQIDWPPE
ncbi:MAG TPA: Uma2 family endonuclease [Solirubrobacteraceae bacterium]|nr:Uma2 family endonuclease [Solirubrobacteraceae bacterium]